MVGENLTSIVAGKRLRRLQLLMERVAHFLAQLNYAVGYSGEVIPYAKGILRSANKLKRAGKL